MTNPDNIVRVRARNGGRASVYEANGWAQAFSSGLVEGNGVTQNTVADMNVLVGGSATKPDVVLAENPSGYKIALDLVTQQAVTITTPASNSRISAIVAYTDDLSLPTTEDTVTGSPASCGLIVVNGTAAATPSVPSDATIRSAITADGATGSQAAYCIIATILVANDATAITDNEITINQAAIGSQNIDFTTFPTDTKVLSANKTMTNVGGYNYKSVPELTFSAFPCIIGAKYLICTSFSAKPSATNEVYSQIKVDTNVVKSVVTSGVVANTFCAISNSWLFTATSSSHDFAISVGTSGTNDTSLELLRNASIIIVRVG